METIQHVFGMLQLDFSSWTLFHTVCFGRVGWWWWWWWGGGGGGRERLFFIKTFPETCCTCVYRWFLWGVASLPEGKSRGLCLVQLCAKYRLVSATLSPYH